VHIASVSQKGKNVRVKCPHCGHWNRVPVNKIFVEQPSPEPKVKVLIPMYEPLEVNSLYFIKEKIRGGKFS